ncbi:glucose-6-phosphate 1-dehydrogenase [Sediminihabitans luteus]|uniref:Glucose-6-phosphate 1-dehydrogenase n=1 Tax=Sediminihabitans luteus TaxID=1138585 RepID=A0A2M9CD76_9CELL|nr:glucose-6-phosphate dehydrogenase [Sediminihabitans luteus]PJJ69298.1 glucose-6-phosphate 1-dehydrogenase [Sediminihabitans luteus]GII98980.1 glucose-6-phosphate 1-dehydrogenase [Sediminihabitans luteus]
MQHVDLSHTDPDLPEHLVLILHGSRGDLSKRMVLASLYLLHRRGLLPRTWQIIGTGQVDDGDDAFRAEVRDAFEEHTDQPLDAFDEFAQHLSYAYQVEKDSPWSRADDVAAAVADGALVVHYLAIPPTAFAPATEALAAQGLLDGARVVYEKPFGTSPETFAELDDLVHEHLDESQVFRIDHFLAKEGTQNLHVLRFANELFKSVWNREHVLEVQVDVPETLDVAQRASFYDATGAALDMLVTHLFQVASEVALETPDTLEVDELVAAREEVFRHFRELDPEDDVVLGQFDGYTAIDGVADDSQTDTYVAARLWIDTDRWRGVPFVLRTGKRLARGAQRVTLIIRSPESGPLGGVGIDSVSVSIAGDGRIEISTTVKRPGPELVLAQGTAVLDFDDVAVGEALPPYASAVHDVLVGDRRAFTTSATLHEAWRAFAPLLGERRPTPVPYAPGSMGPAEADRLVSDAGWCVTAPDDAAGTGENS